MKDPKNADHKIHLLHWLILVVFIVCVALFYLLNSSEIRNSSECMVCEECQEAPVCTTCEVCEVCPPAKETITEVTKYVCEDGKVVQKPGDCFIQEVVEPEVVPEPEEITVQPIKTTEDGTFVKYVLVTPGCTYRDPGGQVQFELAATPETATFQIRDITAGEVGYTDYLTIGSVKKTYKDFAICDDCLTQADFTLKENKVYFLRMKFDRTKLYNEIRYSNEYVIDTRPGSKFMQTC